VLLAVIMWLLWVGISSFLFPREKHHPHLWTTGCQNPWRFWWLPVEIETCRYLSQFWKWAQIAFHDLRPFDSCTANPGDSFLLLLYIVRTVWLFYYWLWSLAFSALSLSHTHTVLALSFDLIRAFSKTCDGPHFGAPLVLVMLPLRLVEKVMGVGTLLRGQYLLHWAMWALIADPKLSWMRAHRRGAISLGLRLRRSAASEWWSIMTILRKSWVMNPGKRPSRSLSLTRLWCLKNLLMLG
jgi:hypothetical protein